MKFPVVVLYPNDMTVYETVDGLTVCRSSDLSAGEQGRFARATIVDSNGISFLMNGADRVDNPSWLGWLGAFSNRKLRVKLRFLGAPSRINLDQFKQEVAERLAKDNSITLVLKIGCTTLGEQVARSLAPAVMRALDARQTILVLIDAPFPERERWAELAGAAADAR